MFWKTLKPLRVIISVFFFLWILFLFTDSWTDWSINAGNSILGWQFIPSLIHFCSSLALLSGGFFLISLLSLIFGRVYCSSLCPLGTFQDIMIRAGRLFKRKPMRRFRFSKPQSITRYSILFLVIILFAAGNVSLLILLDPYSYFGKLSSELFRPAFSLMFDEFVYVLYYYGIYGLAPLEHKVFLNEAFYLALALFLIISILAIFKGRWYCNVLCPVGTFLGLISKYSVFRIQIQKSSCTRCGSCARVCKSNCIDMRDAVVDSSRCVSCQNCISVCPEGGIRYAFAFRASEPEKDVKTDFNPSRRLFLAQSGLGIGVLASSGVLASVASQESSKPQRVAITPPGSFGRSYFTERCTACGLCISQCPSQVLQPAFLEYGISGMMQAFMDFRSGYCNYECTVCGHVCPTGAILPLKKDEKKRTQIGIARFIEEECIVITKGTQCGACSEHCPTKACDMVLYKNNLNIPFLEPDRCIGCGACEYICPTFPKSIIVDENKIHLTAKKSKKIIIKQNTEKQVDNHENTAEDFPF
jgi:ferredoxin